MSSLLRWLSRRPLWFAHGLGAALGWLIYLASPAYRRRFKANAAQADVPWPLARPAIAEAGKLVCELPFLWLRPGTQPVQPRVRWTGAALAAQAHAQGRGILLLTPHMGSFEVSAQAYAEKFGPSQGPLTVLYRPARQAWLRERMQSGRDRPHMSTAPASLAGVRQMIRALRRGEAVGLLPDQVPPDGMGVWAPFFGRSAYTMTLASRLLQQSGAVPLLVWGERLPGGAGYVIHLSSLPGVAKAPTAAPTAQAESVGTINRAMEDLIRQRPQQYLWGYNRYKQPRSGEAPARPGNAA